MSRIRWLLNPWTVFSAMALAVFCGIYFPVSALTMEPYGQIFIAIMKMCTIPILLSAVAGSLGKFVKNRTSPGRFGSFLIIMFLSLVLYAGLGLLAGFVLQPGTGVNQQGLGESIAGSSYAPDLEMKLWQDNPVEEEYDSFLNFITQIIPRNIFHALTHENMVQILIFAILAGIASGFITRDKKEHLFKFLDGVYLTFSKILKNALYLLPLGIFFLIAFEIAAMGPGVLVKMLKFILTYAFSGLLLVALNLFIIHRFTTISLRRLLRSLKEPLVVAVSTGSTTVTLPIMLTSLPEELELDTDITDMLIPVIFFIFRFAFIFFFAYATVFVAQLYNLDWNLSFLLIALVGAILASMASSGAGFLTTHMLALVLIPLGLPADIMIVLFMGIDQLICRITIIVLIFTSVTYVALYCRRKKEYRSQKSEVSSQY